MVNNHYRWDFIGLSTDTKPTPQTSEKVVDGSTFYCSDTSKLYVFCQGTWYERKSLGGGGGGGDEGWTELSTADYNYPTNNPTSVGIWMLSDGKYHAPSGVRVAWTNGRYWSSGDNYFTISAIENTPYIHVWGYDSTAFPAGVVYTLGKATGGEVPNSIIDLRLENSLTSNHKDKALTAYMGKTLNDRITALEARVTTLEGN